MHAPNTPGQAHYAEASVRVAWKDRQNQMHCIVGRCIDVTDRRIHIQVTERIPLNEHVSLLGGGLNSNGAARVRYVTSYNKQFILVLDRIGTEQDV